MHGIEVNAVQVIKNETFERDLDNILDFIAHDSLDRAIIFNRELETHLNELPFMPYKFRSSIHFEDENIRDYIFKGYVIPYFIDVHADCIVLLGIVKYREEA